MRRTTVGILAIFLLALGAIVALRGPADGSAAGFAGGCMRVGLVLAALWLALPQIMAAIKRLPGWMVGWVVRGDKTPPAGKAPQAEGKPVPVKRPRRRSNT